jgi:hypothetical protein
MDLIIFYNEKLNSVYIKDKREILFALSNILSNNEEVLNIFKSRFL